MLRGLLSLETVRPGRLVGVGMDGCSAELKSLKAPTRYDREAASTVIPSFLSGILARWQ